MRGGRRRSRERQPERRTDGDDGVMVIEEVTRQTRNLNIDSTPSAVNGTTFNARTVRPPPGFGVLSPEEAIGSADESPENEVELRNVAHTSPRIRAEDFPTLSDAMRVNTSNNSGTIKNYSERVKQKKSKPVDKHKPVDKPKPADKPIQSVASSSRSETPLNFNSHQQTMYGSANKGKTPAFPPLPSANQSTSASSSGSSSSLNYREKALSNPFDSENSSRNSQFHQRISTFLSNNPAKMEDFKSFTTAYNNSILDASSYIEELSLLFNKKKDIGKVVSGLVEILEGEKKKTDLLRAWHDHKAKQTDDFPALEPPYSPISSMTNNSKPNITSPKSPKPSPRVLVIKSSTNRSGGGTKASSGPRVWDKIAAIAESKIKEKNNSAFPSLSSAVNNSSNDVWRGSVPKFVQSPPRSESTSSSVNNSPAATNISSFTTTFVKGRPTKAENEEFPGLPLTPKSSHSQQRYNNNVPEKSAWGQGGAFTVSDNSKNENDSEDDSSFSESTKEGGKKKKQKKQKAKTVLFHVGQKNIY
ncbi:hypothetical protein C1645_68273 [Glomus cerebriforme]|uniref:ZNF598/HEL2 PAH domain-containing protein n=1 Tax=Glomus cerebriforme TaxID=658196 RepID=A0A397TC20_9GLOM|nr:hypothetical protein C1645_68273 [Glomus cerebriforme]